MNFRKRTDNQRTGFQMAPMVDIMFLLLIFFMVSALYADWETSIDIEVPSATSGARAERQAGEIIINVEPGGQFVVNQTEMSASRLENLLQRVAAQYPNQPVIVRADAETPHKHVVTVLDICKQVDIWNIAFATLPQSQEKGGNSSR
ncbi:MAG: ExbD/TolR family protein [Lentisphaeria bacterium]